MSQQADRALSERVRRAGIALIAGAAIAAIAAPAAQAMAWKNLIVVPPKDLPQLVRQGGDAMLLHDTVDGRTLLYVERGEGGRLDSGAGAPRDYQVLDAANLQQLQPLSEVKQVRQQLDNAATGTTFPLTDEGLYLIRRPSAETAKQFRDQTYAN
jgi:hypothetical protein